FTCLGISLGWISIWITHVLVLSFFSTLSFSFISDFFVSLCIALYPLHALCMLLCSLYVRSYIAGIDHPRTKYTPVPTVGLGCTTGVAQKIT
ncbi:hypothetical protein BGX38DRAFT_1153281, partial [Terfezia claveryi]